MQIDTKYLIKEKDRHGNVRVYYRKKPGPRIRIREKEGTPEFLRAYVLASQGKSTDPRAIARASRPNNPRLKPPQPGTLRDLIVRYYKAPEFWKELDPRTQRVRKLILDKLCEAGGENGKKPYGQRAVAGIEPRHIRAIRDEIAERPEAANGIIKALRQVFAYGLEASVPGVKSNPARDVKYLKSDGDGHHSWSIEEVEAFEAKHPVGGMARLALALLLYTGQRRSDIVRMGPGNVKNGWLTFTQFKGRKRKPITLAIPVIPELRNIIDKTPGTGEAFLMNELRRPFTAAGFGNWFHDRCVEVKDERGRELVPGRAHGLRKAGATIAANNGATPFELTAMYGWSSTKVAEIYTQKADKVRLAERAANKLYPHPAEGAGNVPPKPLKIKASR